MNNYFALWATLIFLSLYSCQTPPPPQTFPMISVDIPVTRQDTVVDDYHGTSIADPYRWLEDDTSDETGDWVKEQNKATYAYIDQIPFRDAIRDRLEALWDYEKYGSPFKEGDKYYYFKNDGLQNQYVLYAADSPVSEGVVVLDPNTFSADGTASLGGMSFDKSGRYLAYFVSEGGSDWRTGYVKDMSSGELLADKIEWAKFSGLSWQEDGFYYSRYPQPESGDELSAANEYHAVYYHKLGTDQEQDERIYVDELHPQRNVYAGTTEDERFVIVSKSAGTSGNALSIIDREKGGDLIDIVTDFESDYTVLDSDGSSLLVMTNDDAPRQRVIRIDADNPGKEAWTDVIPQSEDALRDVSVVGNRLFATYLHDASSLVKVYEIDGTFVQDLKLPGIGTVSGVSGKKSYETGFYSFTSFTKPSTIYELDTKTLSSKVFRESQVDFDSDDYETIQEWYTSKDGTKVPMFITRRKGLEMDGQRPTLLYGYGGFDIPITPSFSLKRLPLLENGGLYVVANIRGGGEFGKEWHQAGTKERKQNVFDDFIAAAEYLIANGYTTSDKLAIEGRSNGGLLVGATMTQRPELFAVAFPHVGVLDMLRYHEFTIGWAWAGDYGRSDDPEAFQYLHRYSPLHNVKPVAYPATMVATADHDDRVVPAHSFKFISELQAQHTGDTPVLIRVETSAGHGAGKPTSMQIDENADYLAFMLYNMKESYHPVIKD